MVKAEQGQCLILLHAHLPWVRHAEHGDPFEERWLHEAVAECYLPLLRVLEGWRRDGVPFRLALSLSPTLVAMLDDPLLRERTAHRLGMQRELARREAGRKHGDPDRHALACYYRDLFETLYDDYETRWRRDLPGAFDGFAHGGGLELLTCTATHAFLPLLQAQPAWVRLQVELGHEAFAQRFGRRPAGMWLPECGFYPGLDPILTESATGYVFMDGHGVEQATPRPPAGVHAPVRCSGGPVAFGRDADSARQVWSAESGYPGNGVYRDFYRDLGHDLPLSEVGEFIHESGRRLATGLKYHRVTGRGVPLEAKALYDPRAAHAQAEAHARDFVLRRAEQVARLRAEGIAQPLIVAPYDAELFGHWWHEGPAFLDAVMRGLCAVDSPVAPLTPSDALADGAALPVVEPALSSWGEGGYAGVWLNDENAWIYPELDSAGEHVSRLALRLGAAPGSLERRALRLATREVLLAQASDWAFMMRMGTTVEYARRRTREHLDRAEHWCGRIRAATLDEVELTRDEGARPIWQELDLEGLLGRAIQMPSHA